MPGPANAKITDEVAIRKILHSLPDVHLQVPHVFGKPDSNDAFAELIIAQFDRFAAERVASNDE